MSYKMVQIKDLYVKCALQVRNHGEPGIAMSDCCGGMATSAVVMDNGHRMWRCEAHKGIRRIETGEVITEVLQKVKERTW